MDTDFPDGELLEVAPDAMVVVDEDGIIVLVNSQTEILFGYTRDNMLGKPVELLIPERYQAAHPQRRNNYCENPRVRAMGEGLDLLGRKFDGEEFPVEISLSPLQTQGRRFVASAIRDVSYRRDIEQQLREAKVVAENATLTKSQFLTAASHDLRQPLQSISLYLAVTRRKLQKMNGTQEIAEIVEKMDASLNVMTELLDALLDISRLDSGNVAPEWQDIELDVLLQRLLVEYEPSAREKNLELRLQPTHAWIRSDAGLLQRVLENFVSNAIRYTEQGSVTLLTEKLPDESDGTLRIDVVDTGSGIPEEAQEAIFGEYFQLDNPVRDRDKGLGLGLSIVKHISNLLGHRLEVSSLPGQGARFSVIVPQCEGPGMHLTGKKPAADASIGDFADRSILLVDDDPAIIDATKMLLELSGVSVVTAVDGHQALEHMAGGLMPDLIVSDFRLPGDNGVELIHKIRQLYGNDCPVVLVTGDTSAKEVEGAGLSGAVIMRKPVDTDRLLKIVQDRLLPED